MYIVIEFLLTYALFFFIIGTSVLMQMSYNSQTRQFFSENSTFKFGIHLPCISLIINIRSGSV